MLKHLFAYIQYLLPQHLISCGAGALANSKNLTIKNNFIKKFIHLYKIDMKEAVIENPEDYASFNEFFIRYLKPALRVIDPAKDAIVSPADGKIAEAGKINQQLLLQAKGQYFDLKGLLGNDTALAQQFENGQFATVYLAPNNYHRVHMPISGKLIKTIYIPGKLFSVNRITSDLIPQLYSRNERFVAIFETGIGPVAVILVGAMIVGSIQTVWMQEPIRANQIVTDTRSETITLEKGAELGHFKLGSTVIMLFGNNQMEWLPNVQTNASVKFGQSLGKILSLS
ncbi:MAG: archaetidylserine decarboxylase [Gammaproteobacteria bacterium]